MQVAINANILSAKGKLGELKMVLTEHVETTVEGNHVKVAPKGTAPQARVMWGTTRANIANLLKGVSVGYTKTMEITGTGYRAAVTGPNLVINLGFSHDVIYPVPLRHHHHHPEGDDDCGGRHGQAPGGPGCGRNPRLASAGAV